MTLECYNSLLDCKKNFKFRICHRNDPKKWVVMPKTYFQIFSLTQKFCLFSSLFSHSEMGEIFPIFYFSASRDKVINWETIVRSSLSKI